MRPQWTTVAALLLLAAAAPTAASADPRDGYRAALPGGTTGVEPSYRKGKAALPGGANEGASSGEAGSDAPAAIDSDNQRPAGKHAKHKNRQSHKDND
jgi:hypothetical protein